MADPEVALVPDQPPLALQLVALALLQLNVDVPPLQYARRRSRERQRGCSGGLLHQHGSGRNAVPPAPVQASEKRYSR